MRLTIRTSALAVCALLLAACSASPAPDGSDLPSAPPTSSEAPDDPENPDVSETGAPSDDVPTDLPPEALLQGSAWEALTGPREESDGVVAWRLPEACTAGEPTTAATMRTVTQGDSAEEAPVGVQQVALFADADAAAAEADRLAAAVAACAEQVPDDASGGTTYVAEPVEVGAQGTGLATDYYGAAEGGGLDDALGTYLATTRRGTAVTLVALDGGESTVGVARETVTGNAQAAWELLCAYDSAGC